MAQENINEILGIGSTQNQSNDNSNKSRTRYPALMTISGIFVVFAWIVGISALIVTFYFLSADSKILRLISFIFGGLIVLGLVAISESIKVFIDIEYNTRQKKNKE